MARKFQIKRGLKADMPTLAQGELGMTTDTGSEGLFIGTGTENIEDRPSHYVRLGGEGDFSSLYLTF